MAYPTVVVVSGGLRLPADAGDLIVQGSLVVAADGGVDHALALGVMPAVVVGDFDSVSAAGLVRVTDAGARVVRHPVDKDATDLELALHEALALGAARIVVLGDDGGRLDHLLATAAVLTAPAWAAVDVVAHLGDADVHVVRAGTDGVIVGDIGQVVTLLPFGGPATSVTTRGLRFALDGATLESWTSRGVSNELVASSATVAVGSGVLLGVVPDAAARRASRK
jgi:thiamine pyrophosphokinase